MPPQVEDRVDAGKEWASAVFFPSVLTRGFKSPELPKGYTWYPAGEDIRPNSPPTGELILFQDQFKYGLSLPFSEEVKSICRELKIIPTMMAPNGLSIVQGMAAMFKEVGVPWRVDTLCWFMSPRVMKGGFCYFTPRKKWLIHTADLPSSLSGWKKRYFRVRLPPGATWGFDLTPGKIPMELYAPSKAPAGANTVMEWIGARACVLHLARPFMPGLSFTDRGAKQPAQASEDKAEKTAKRKKKAVVSRGPSQKKQKIIFEEHVPVEGNEEEISGGEEGSVLPVDEIVKAAAISPPQAAAGVRPEPEKEAASLQGEGEKETSPSQEGSAEKEEPFIRWTNDGTVASVGPIPRCDTYGVDPSSSKAFDALQVINSGADWEQYEKSSFKKLNYMMANHVVNAGQIGLYLGSIGAEMSKQTRGLNKVIAEKEQLLKTRGVAIQQARVEVLAAGEREKELKARLEQAEKNCAEKDAEISSLRAAAQAEKLSAQQQVVALQNRAAELEAAAKAQQSRFDAIPSTDVLFAEYRNSLPYANEMLGVSEETFALTRDYLDAHGILSSDKISKLKYIDVEEWLLKSRQGSPPPPTH